MKMLPIGRYGAFIVIAHNLCQKDEYTQDLFSISQPEATEKVTGVFDAINSRWGRGTMHLASVPTNPDWGVRREMMSQSFTTCIDQLWTVYCRWLIPSVSTFRLSSMNYAKLWRGNNYH